MIPLTRELVKGLSRDALEVMYLECSADKDVLICEHDALLAVARAADLVDDDAFIENQALCKALEAAKQNHELKVEIEKEMNPPPPGQVAILRISCLICDKITQPVAVKPEDWPQGQINWFARLSLDGWTLQLGQNICPGCSSKISAQKTILRLSGSPPLELESPKISPLHLPPGAH